MARPIVLICVALLAIPLAACVCNVGIGNRATGDGLIQTMDFKNVTTNEPKMLTLTVTYQADADLNEEITHYKVVGSVESCTITIPISNDKKRVFLTMESSSNVTEFSTTLEVYGFRKGKSVIFN
uniref:Uncharacterized protein n=1 Tax=Anopheles farauti TaxID=69004 RepID=A0A182QH89_9DIPT